MDFEAVVDEYRQKLKGDPKQVRKGSASSSSQTFLPW
jgi:hypothetical protein